MMCTRCRSITKWIQTGTMRRLRVVSILILTIGLTAQAFGQTLFLDFNTPGQYTANFNPWNDSGGVNAGNYSFTESTTAGVNGSGAVNVFQNTDTTVTYNGGGWNFSTNGAVMVVSAL